MRIAILLALGITQLLLGCAMTPEERISRYSQNLSATLSISDVEVSAPNSVGGVSLRVSFINSSYTTYKYVRMWFIARNRVGDTVKSEIGGDGYGKIQFEGPFARGDVVQSLQFGPLWYNASITCVALTRVVLVDFNDRETVFDWSNVHSVAANSTGRYCYR